MDRHGDKLMFISEDMSLTDEHINLIYNAADIGVSCADAEGFGLCSFEMMGLGKPQIVSDQVGTSEFCNGENSLVVPTKSIYYVTNMESAVAGEAHGCEPDDVRRAMTRYIDEPDLLVKHGAAATATVSAYTWLSLTTSFIMRLRLI